MHIIAAKAVCFKEALDNSFKEYTEKIVENAKTLADELQKRGFRIVSDKTENHLLLVDTTKVGMTGKEAEEILGEVDITVNKNAIPFDKYPPMVASGIRIGTPAVTTRGFGKDEMVKIAEIMEKVIKNPKNEEIKKQAKIEVRDITNKFPVPGIDKILSIV